MNAHTPGPWHHGCSKDDPDFLIRTADEWLVCCASNEGNARLIAAAPELLEALTNLLCAVDTAIAAGDWKIDGACEPELDILRARAAIAKAEGKP